jgi:hypothetical protein
MFLGDFIKGKGPGRRKEPQVAPDPRLRYGEFTNSM